MSFCSEPLLAKLRNLALFGLRLRPRFRFLDITFAVADDIEVVVHLAITPLITA
jgi:hypothetical protein